MTPLEAIALHTSAVALEANAAQGLELVLCGILRGDFDWRPVAFNVGAHLATAAALKQLSRMPL